MSFTKGKVKDFFLLTTDVENIFLNEYMPGAPGDFVKVYLYGLLYGESEVDMSNEVLAKQLRISEKTAENAWDYWESMGVIKKIPKKNKEEKYHYDIEFINLRELMYGKGLSKDAESEKILSEGKKEETDTFYNQDSRRMITAIENLLGKMLSPRETKEIYSWKTDLGAPDEIIQQAYSYCVEKQKTSVRYVEKVLMQWMAQGLKTTEEVEEYLEQTGRRQGNYKRVLQSLGMNRGATEAEKRMMDTWFQDMHYNIERVLEACDTTLSTPNPNLRYVNKVLENWYNEAKARGTDVNKKVTVTQAVLNKYYEYLRRKEELKAQERKEEVYGMIPRIEEIDQERNELSSKLTRGLLTGMTKEEQNKIKRLENLLEEERAVLLTENNFPIDYTDIKYLCEKCGDTGFDENGQRCSCARERTGEAELWQKSN